MRSALLAASFAVALFACGGKTPPPATVAVPPADAGAVPVATVPAGPIDAIPKDAVSVASIDSAVLVQLFGANDDAKLLQAMIGIDASNLAAVGIDPARPLLLAQVGISDAARAVLASSATFTDADELLKTVHATPFAALFRVVVPVTDAARAKAALAKILDAFEFTADGANAYTTKRESRIEVASDAKTLVLDVAMGRDAKTSIADLRARIRAGQADPPALGPGEALHVVYRPSQLAELSAYADVVMMTSAVSGASISSSQRQAILKQGLPESQAIETLLGPTSAPVVDHVDVIGRRDGHNLAFELRATPGPGSRVPGADAWKPGASFAPDGSEGFVTFSPAFASAWKLGGDAHDATLTSSTAARGAIRSLLSVIAALPLGVPMFARLTGRISGFPDTAYARFDRAGETITGDGRHLDIGLLAKDVKPADAACILAPKTPCTTKLVLGAPAIAVGKQFARLVPVKGTTAVAVAVASPDTKAALEGLKLHLTTAGPLEANLPQNLGDGVEIPWIGKSQRLALGVELDGRVVSAKLTPTPPSR